MLDRSSYHDRFAQMLGGDDDAVTPWLADPAHVDRLRVYRNNMVTAWADAILKNYPTVERLVGAEFMRAMSAAFACAHPPQSPVLSLYGDAFPAFVESFPPAVQLPYLADVARLDRAWTESYFGANVRPLGPGDLSGLGDDEMAELRLHLHPSLRIAAASCNAFDIWKANRAEGQSPNVAYRPMPSAAMVWWSPNGMQDRALSTSEHKLLELIGRGTLLGEALGRAAPEQEQPALLAFFSDALMRGVFVKSKDDQS